MPKQHLSDQFLKNLKPSGKRIEYYDQHLIENNKLIKKGVKGLFARLTKAGSIYFYYRYWFNGKPKSYKIGTYPNIGLAEARDKARQLAGDVNRGIDPQAEKNAKKRKPKPKVFDDLVKRFKAQHLPTLKESTQNSYRIRIDGIILPAFKGRPVKDISRGEIMELLEDIAFEQGKGTQSNRVRAILSSIYSFAVQREIADFNPVKTIKPLGKEVRRDRVLTEKEIKDLWEQFSTLEPPSGSLLKILLLLGQRKGETSRMKWEHIKDGIWTIPKDETKANRIHHVPLPPLAIEIIEGLKNDSPYVFESNMKKGEPVQWLQVGFRRVTSDAGIDNARIHDLRRTAATYMAELGTDRTILGKVLNHKGLAGDSQVTARYDRYSYLDEKRQALNRWSHKLQQIIEGKTETKVYNIR